MASTHSFRAINMAATKAELVGRAKELVPGIAARAEACEQLRAPHDDTIRELIDAQLFELLVPKRWGGHELGLDAQIEIVEVLSSACMSTGWIAAFYMGHNWMAIKYSEQAQAEIFDGKPYALIPAAGAPTLTAKRVDGGWLVSGRATWGSGIMHADWVLAAGMDDEGTARQFLLPATDVTIDDVWYMSGMAGTGSNDFVANEAFVPDHRSLPAAEFFDGKSAGARQHDNPFYQMPVLPFIWCETMAVFSGALRGALNAYDETVCKRVTTHAGAVLKDQQHSHINLGEAHTSVLIAESLVQDQLRKTEPLVSGGVADMALRTELKARAGFIVEHCRTSINRMAHKAGATNFRTDAPLQRFFRDINVLATHAFWDWSVCREQLGRVRLGLDPNNPLL